MTEPISYYARCTVCGNVSDTHACSRHGSVHFSYGTWAPEPTDTSIWRYRTYLPVSPSMPPITLGEGDTPVLRAKGKIAGSAEYIWLKDETRNPTGSMKDRAMAVAYSRLQAEEQPRSIIASAGGSGISAAAYAARTGVPHWVLVPDDVSTERLVLPAVYGAHIVRVHAPFEAIADLVDQARVLGYTNVSTYRLANPFQAEATKTIAYELVEQLGRSPSAVIIPVGGGGTLAGVWQGFKDLAALGIIRSLPRMVSVQNSKFNALERVGHLVVPDVAALRRASADIDESQPTATASVRHAYPPDGEWALNALVESKGFALSATDSEALDGQRLLAKTVGIFCEPSSGLAVAAIGKAQERLGQGADIVVIITGSGFRDTAAITGSRLSEVPEVISASSVLDRLVL